MVPVVAKFPLTLDLKLKVGENCIFGINCDSKFCSPNFKVCAEKAESIIKPAQIKDSMARNFVTLGGVCAAPYAEAYSCLTAANGEPLEEWDQTKCGCHEE